MLGDCIGSLGRLCVEVALSDGFFVGLSKGLGWLYGEW